MRAFWTLFFLGSMLLLTADVRERRRSPETALVVHADGDPWGFPTPNP